MEISVDIEYCGVCNFKKQCTDLSKILKTRFPDSIITCRQGRRGSFEVVINGVLVHSKLASLALPEFEDVSKKVQDARDGRELTKVKEQPITDCIIM